MRAVIFVRCLMHYVTAVEIWNRDLYKIPHKGQLLKKCNIHCLSFIQKRNCPPCARYLEKCLLFAFTDTTLFLSGDF